MVAETSTKVRPLLQKPNRLRSLSPGRSAVRLHPSRPYTNIAAMPTMAHETIVDLFKFRPSLDAELLSKALGVALHPTSKAVSYRLI